MEDVGVIEVLNKRPNFVLYMLFVKIRTCMEFLKLWRQSKIHNLLVLILKMKKSYMFAIL